MDNGSYLEEAKKVIGLGLPVAHVGGLPNELRERDALA